MAALRIAEWSSFAVLLLVPGMLAGVFVSPLLLASRIRQLFRTLPPTRSPYLNYGCYAVVLSLPWVVGTGLVVTRTSPEGAALSNAILNLVVILGVVYVIGLPLLAGVLLPRLGVEWDQTGYGVGTWLLLVGGSIGYTVSFAVPLFGFAVVLALPT